MFRLPFTGRVGERKGYGQHSEKLADPVGVNEVGRASRSAVVARPRRSPKPSPHLHPLLAEQGVVGQTESGALGTALSPLRYLPLINALSHQGLVGE